jgi:hypothetical protein
MIPTALIPNRGATEEIAMKVPKPAGYYAKFAKLFRERGLEVQDDDFELIDAAIAQCDRLLDLRCLLAGS